MWVLGISAYYHDSASALIKDGEIVAAAQEERFTRKKHDSSFPRHAIQYCLEEAGLKSPLELDAIVFYEKPLLKLERLLETFLYFVPRGYTQFEAGIKTLLFDKKLFMKDLLLTEFTNLLGLPKKEIRNKLYFTEHHLSHAASAFYPSPFRESAILTIDGVGEWATACLGFGQDKNITILKSLNFPHSLGLLYSAFTYFCGFKVNSGEYKLMGLAPYGNPHSPRTKKFKELIKTELIDIAEDGSIKINMEYFDYCTGLKMINEEKWVKLFGIPLRKPETDITQEYADLALAIQEITEEIIFKMAKEVKKLTGSKNLCLAGGVALNCVANGKLLASRLFEDIWIQPAAGDAGGALGAALAYYYLQPEVERVPEFPDSMKGSYLGPQYSKWDIMEVLIKYRADFEEINDEESLCERVAKLLAEGKVVGWFQGRMEWGPRALGNRSILADPRNPEMQRKLNLKIKFREGFRPFAPVVLIDCVREYFQYGFRSPYMLLIDYIREDKRNPLPENYYEFPWQDKLYFIRSELPAITHIDYSARVQTVEETTNPLFYKLLKKFRELTGCGVLINTSFNVRGEPIVCSPEDAFKCFMRTDMDYLVMGSFLLDKDKQPVKLKEILSQGAKYELD